MKPEKLRLMDAAARPENTDALTAFGTALREAIDSVDGSGRVSWNAARSLQQALSGAGEDTVLGVALAPERIIGPFEVLARDAQIAIVKAITADDRWRMRGHEMGDWHVGLARLFTGLRWKFTGLDLKRLAAFSRMMAVGARSGPAHLIYSLYKGLLSGKDKILLRRTVPSLLSRLGIDTRDLAACYARGVPQPSLYRGYYNDASQHNTYGVILGIDLLPTAAGFCYIESNLDFGMSSTRAAMYHGDPFVSNLIAFAAEQGYRNLVLLHKSSSYVNGDMARQYQDEAAAKKIRLVIVEDVYLPSQSGYRQSHGVPCCDDTDTLVVRSKCYRTSLDHLFQHKNASIRALSMYRQKSGDPMLHLPLVGARPVFGDAGLEDPFPNLVYKLPERDEGKGVIFLKVASSEHAVAIIGEAARRSRPKGFLERLYAGIEDKNGLYQQYVRSPLLSGRRLYKIRAHVLVTPVGVSFLSAHRVISRHAVPEHLPVGIVQDPRPYLVNLSTSSHYELIPPEEEPAVIDSALAVGRGLSWAAAYGFEYEHE